MFSVVVLGGVSSECLILWTTFPVLSCAAGKVMLSFSWSRCFLSFSMDRLHLHWINFEQFENAFFPLLVRSVKVKETCVHLTQPQLNGLPPAKQSACPAHNETAAFPEAAPELLGLFSFFSLIVPELNFKCLISLRSWLWYRSRYSSTELT